MIKHFVTEGSEVTECENKTCQQAAAALVNLLEMINALDEAYKESFKVLSDDDPKKPIFEGIIYNFYFMTTHINGCDKGNCSKAHT